MVSTGGGLLPLLGTRYEAKASAFVSNVYLHQHPADANMTIEELREMVNSMSGKQM